MSKISIRVDLDDVLNRFSEYFIDYHYKQTGEELENNKWDLHHNSKYGINIWDHLSDNGFFSDIPMERNADKLIEYLDYVGDSKFDYQIISSYYGDSEKDFRNIFLQKKAWVYEHFGEKAVKKFKLVQGGKEEFPADIVIDDFYENLLYDNLSNSLKLYFIRDHNKNKKLDVPYVTRVTEHNTIIDLIKDISFYEDIESYLKKEYITHNYY